jgi:hypothetical protein
MVFGRAPEFFSTRGADDITAGRYSLWLVALILAPCAVILFKGLKGGTAVRQEDRPPVRKLVIGGLQAAKNPRIALAYFSAFVSRSDFVVIGTFTVLWATVAGIEQGLTAAQAVQRGAMLFVLANTAALSFGAAVAAFVFGAMGFIDDPLSRSAMPWFAMLGIGQTSCFFASQALIGQEANIKERGSVIGLFGFCGAVGILLATSIGGQLFDSWKPSAPFVLISIANAMVFVFALIVRLRAPGGINRPEDNGTSGNRIT